RAPRSPLFPYTTLFRSLDARLGIAADVAAFERAFADAVTVWQRDEALHAEPLDLAMRYAAWAAHTPAGRATHRDGVLFRAPRKLDPMKLVPIVPVKHAGVAAFTLDEHHHRERAGFALTDPGTDLIGGLDQAHY